MMEFFFKNPWILQKKRFQHQTTRTLVKQNLFKLTSGLIVFSVSAGLLCYINGVFPYSVHYNFPKKVDELTERQNTTSKKQAHVTTKLTWKRNTRENLISFKKFQHTYDPSILCRENMKTVFSLLKGSDVFRSHFVREIKNASQSVWFVFKNNLGSAITW